MPKSPPTAGRVLPDRGPPAPRPPARRSAVTNGTRVFHAGDEQSPWTRRFVDLCEGHVRDLGDPDDLSEAQLALVRSVATLRVNLEGMEAAMSKGEEVDVDLYQRCVNTLGRQLDRLGLKRVRASKTVNPLMDHFSRPAEPRG